MDRFRQRRIFYAGDALDPDGMECRVHYKTPQLSVCREARILSCRQIRFRTERLFYSIPVRLQNTWKSNPNTQTFRSASGREPSHFRRSSRYSHWRCALGQVQNIWLSTAVPAVAHSGKGTTDLVHPSYRSERCCSLVDIASFLRWSVRKPDPPDILLSNQLYTFQDHVNIHFRAH